MFTTLRRSVWLLAPVLAFGQGSQLPKHTVATLPAASSLPTYTVQVIDGANDQDCVTGHGSKNVLCKSNGTSWVPVSPFQSLTTVGSSGPASLNLGILNIPTYSGNSTSFRHDGTVLTGDFAATPQVYDYDETSPALDAGFIAAIGHFDTTTGKFNYQVPATVAPAIQPLVNAPVAGQFVILRPHTFVSTALVGGATIGGAGGSTSTPATAVLTNPSLCSLNANAAGQWSGYTLADYGIPAGNVTAIYAYGVARKFVAPSGRACFGTPAPDVAANATLSTAAAGLIPSSAIFGTQQTTSSLLGLAGSDIATTTTGVTLGISTQTEFNTALIVDDVGLIVYYTGSPVTQNTFLNIDPPLFYDASSNALGLDNLFPSALQAITISQLPPAENTYAQIEWVRDGTGITDCTVGGGTTTVACIRALSGTTYIWQAWAGGGGGGGTTTNSMTANSSGGAAPGTTFNGNAARTFDYHSFSAQCQLNLTTTGSSGAATLGACSGGSATLNIPQYAGGSGTPGGSNTQLQYNNAGAFGGDTSTTDGAGNVVVNSITTNGGAGQGGTFNATEGTAASAAAGHDILYADSTAHCIKQSLNGGAFSCLGTGGGGGGYTNVTGSVSETTVAQINTAGASGTYYATTPLSIATGGTITVPVQFSKAGLWTVASGQVVTFSKQVTETDAPVQHFAGSGTVVLAAQNAPVEWFGAVADGSYAGGTGTDNAAAINACITALSVGNCTLLPNGIYRVSSAISIAKSWVGITGPRPVAGTLVSGVVGACNSTCIFTTQAGIDIIDVHGTSGSSYISGNAIEHFSVARSVVPTGTAAGFSLHHTGGLVVDDTQSYDSIYDYNLLDNASFGKGYISNSSAQHVLAYGSATTVYGFYMDGQGVSTRMIRDTYSDNASGSRTSWGAYCNGCVDYMVDRFEAATSSHGIGLTGSIQDVSFRDPTLDTMSVDCINVASASIVSSSIQGGECNSTGAYGANIDGGSSTFQLQGMRFLLSGTTAAIRLHSSASAVQGNTIYMRNAAGGVGVLVDGSGFANISGNKVDNTAGSTTSIAYKFINSAIGNTFLDNTAKSTSVVSTAAAISFDATSCLNLASNFNIYDGGAFTGGVVDTCGNNAFSGASGITGATSGQALIAGSSTTATSSKALAGTGAGITTGPTTSVLHNCPQFANTSGQIEDSGSPCSGGSAFITSLTTTGTSGAATVSSGVLNIPQYSGGSGNYVNLSGSLTATNATCTSNSCTTSGTQTTLTFDTIPGGYNALHIVWNANNGSSGAPTVMGCQFNADTSGHYANQAARTNGGASASYHTESATSGDCGYLGGVAASGTIDIPFYASSTLPKTYTAAFAAYSSVSSGTNNWYVGYSGYWAPTSPAAITKIVIVLSGGTIASGASFAFYGEN